MKRGTATLKSAVKLDEAASILGVSSATVRNWVKQEYLVPLNKNSKRPDFDKLQVIELKNKINSGVINRLAKRANKSNSTNTFVPVEYIDDPNITYLIQSLLNRYESKNLTKESFLFSIILNLLKAKELISFDKGFSDILCESEIIAKEIKWWTDKTKIDLCFEKYSTFLKIQNLPETSDLLGILYQSIKTEGSKSEGGSYYTPKYIVDEIVNDHVKKDSTVVDPCCGTGQFLLSAAGKSENPTLIWGFDVDEIAVRIARMNMILEFPDIDFSPHIYCKNILQESENALPIFLNDQLPFFDVVITNPPWGRHFSKVDKQQLNRNFPEIRSGESFSYFLKVGIDLLKEGGVLSFILPEALLNIKTHKDIREIILKQTKIKKVVLLKRVFRNVFTSVFRMDLQKITPKRSDMFSVQNDLNINNVRQSRFLENSDYRFDVLCSVEDIYLFEKIYNIEHLTLKNNAEWALGIVTGNNKKYISENKTALSEPILTGTSINRFMTTPGTKHIEFIPKRFQQVAPEYKYRAKEKLIYKFISKQLVFSYDDKQTLTLNSANCLIPKLDYPIESILGLFNSSLYQYIYQKKFGSLKILRGEIEQLPLPLLDNKQHKEIEFFVDKLLMRDILQTDREGIYQELNEYVYDLFDLDSQEKDYVKKSVRPSRSDF